MSKIIVVGSSNTDMVVRANKMPVPGETVLGGEFLISSGGKGANQAVAIARLGGGVTFITKIGKDIFGLELLKQFEKEGIHIDFVFRHKSKPTGVALITVGDNAENAIIVAPGANAFLKKKDINKAIDEIKKAAIVLIQLEIPINTVNHIVMLARKYDKKVILNPAPAQKLSDELYASLYVITPNETEAEILTGVKVIDDLSARKAALLLRERGVQNVVITMGASGAYIHSDEVSEIVPGCKVKAKDTTAAGDTFNGVLALGLSNGVGLRGAVEFANKAASLAVTKYGSQSSIPFLADLEMGLTNDVKEEL